MGIEWFKPEEDMPPNGKPVMVNIKFPYCGELHTYGWFTAKGWEVLAGAKEYTVDKWHFLPRGKKI